mmetsp:Transcript_22832/g.63486  ORF Transcript_22832/g.63486 Transcript_22832/m.63486 type:complete len:87 (+) Transcript_22832:114-374(+)
MMTLLHHDDTTSSVVPYYYYVFHLVAMPCWTRSTRDPGALQLFFVDTLLCSTDSQKREERNSREWMHGNSDGDQIAFRALPSTGEV